jgi:hypothetical protein
VNTAQLLATKPMESSAMKRTPSVTAILRRLQRWIGIGSCGGARRRNSARRSRPSRFIIVRTCVGLATPRVAANASAISSGVK